MTAIPCHGCGTTRPPATYLCPTCRAQLPAATQRALNRTDRYAYLRLRQLHHLLDAGIPLNEIQVTP